MGEAARKKKQMELIVSLTEEINEAIKRFRKRKGYDPTRVFLGKVETAVILQATGKDPHQGILPGTILPLPVWTMKAAQTMVDVG